MDNYIYRYVRYTFKLLLSAHIMQEDYSIDLPKKYLDSDIHTCTLMLLSLKVSKGFRTSLLLY